MVDKVLINMISDLDMLNVLWHIAPFRIFQIENAKSSYFGALEQPSKDIASATMRLVMANGSEKNIDLKKYFYSQ